MNRVISGLRLRFGYLRLVPWRFACCESVEGCREVMDQVRSRPLEDHDPLTQDVMRRIGGGHRSSGARGDMTPALQAEVDEIKMCPLDEGPGESYHRGTTHEHTRAPGATTWHPTQHNRLSQELARTRRWVSKHGDRGERILRYEWRNWKRLLQTKWHNRWMPTRDDQRQAFKKMYHEDDMAEEDWTAVVSRQEPVRPVVTDAATTRGQLEAEYLRAVFVPDHYYAVPRRTEHIGEDGQQEVGQEIASFQVVQVRGSHSRPHVMHTFQSADEPALFATCAVDVSPVMLVGLPDELGDFERHIEGVVARPAGIPTWVSADRLAAFDDVAFRMQTWERSEAVPEEPGAIVLSGAGRAKVPMPITDDNCPVISIVSFLQKKQGWVPVERTVVHTDLVSKEYDCREKGADEEILRILSLFAEVLSIDLKCAVATAGPFLSMLTVWHCSGAAPG